MATIPTFEELLLEVHQSLGFKFDPKDKKKLPRLEKPLAGHRDSVERLLDDMFTALGMDPPARYDAMGNVQEWANFDKSVELKAWTFNADRRQILWHLFGYSYAPALGRRIAFWTLHERLDKGMPGGQFWYLPAARMLEGRARLVMPVAQVVDWLRDLFGLPMHEVRLGLGGGAAQARQQEIDDAKKETDVFASMARELDNWRQGVLPHASTIEKYFPDDAQLNFSGTFELPPDMPLDDQVRAALAFLEGKQLDATTMRDEIPMTQQGRLEAIWANQAPDEEARRFVELVQERWAIPSMVTIRRRLLIARMVQDGYRRLGRFLLGDEFDEGCTDPSRNKVLQLIALYQTVFNQTILAAKTAVAPQVQDAWFDSQLAPWDKHGIFLSIAPSRRTTAAVDLAECLTRRFADLHSDSPLEDLVGQDLASAQPIIKRNCLRLKDVRDEAVAILACIQELKKGAPFKKLKQQTSYGVVSQVAQSPELPAHIRNMAIARLREVAATPGEKVEAIVLHLHALFNCPQRERPKDMRAQVEQLLILAEASPGFADWEAVLLRYKAKHCLATNDFASARKWFDAALDACQVRNYGPARGEIARDAFAVTIERPPAGFSLGNYEGYLRNMLAFGALFPNDDGTLPTLEDTACELSNYYWEDLYDPYPGEPVEVPLAQKHTEAIIGEETMVLILRADWEGLAGWIKRNAELRDKRLRHVKGETVLIIWLQGLYRFRTRQPALTALQSKYPSDEVVPIANTLERNLREAIQRLIKAWPKLVNLADFKKKTPLMIAAAQGDAEMVKLLLQAGGDASRQDWQGNTAMDLALASGAPSSVEALRVDGKYTA